MNKIFTQLVKIRGLDDDFLHPKYENLKDPFVLPDMKKAIDRIKKALKNNEKILIYGDYDVDGVTASTLIKEALTLAGSRDIDIMLPDRFTDGYGMSPKIIERAKDNKISLVITVDCGSLNHNIVNELNILNIDTIITDHHECGDNLPEAIAVVNPKRKDLDTPEELKNLAGVGVAFKLAQGLVDSGLIKNGQEKWLLDLVLLGTICDNMTLTGENRILCYYGIKVLEKTRRPGLRELKRIAGVKNITSESVGFQMGPRLNAAGRLDTAELALSLLNTSSNTEAVVIAQEIEGLNKKRREEQRRATEEIAKNGIKDDPVIIETGDWHEGILGIVAGRLVETYHKPAFVLSEVDGDIFKGSGRSFGDFSLAKALEFAKDSILQGGGHAGAAGVKLKREQLFSFREKINEYYKSLKLTEQEKYFKTNADLEILNLRDLSLELLEDLKQLEPFGEGNDEPIFCIKEPEILKVSHMGDKDQHLRIDLKGKDGKILKAVAFFAPEDWLKLDPDNKYDFFIKPVENLWNGVRSVEARICDIITV